MTPKRAQKDRALSLIPMATRAAGHRPLTLPETLCVSVLCVKSRLQGVHGEEEEVAADDALRFALRPSHGFSESFPFLLAICSAAKNISPSPSLVRGINGSLGRIKAAKKRWQKKKPFEQLQNTWRDNRERHKKTK